MENTRASWSMILHVLRRVWNEVCSQKLHRAYRILWMLVFCRFALHSFYSYAFGWAVEKMPSAQSLIAGSLLIAPALATILAEYLFDWQIRISTDRVMSFFFAASETLIDRKFFEKSVGQHVMESGKFTQGAMSRGKNELVNLNEFLAFGGFESVISTMVSMGSLWVVAPRYGAVTSVIFILSVIWARNVNQRIYRDQMRIGVEERATRRRREDLWDAVERVKVNGREWDSVMELTTRTNNLHEEYRTAWWFYQHWTLLRDAINWVGFGIILMLSANDLRLGNMAFSSFMVVVTAGYAALMSVRMLSRMERKLYQSVPHIEKLFELLDLPPDITDTPDAEPLPDRSFSIRFENVGMRLDTRLVLHNITFAIEPGERVAVIGPSGAGKTTVARLLARAMNPTEGAIRVNGRDLRGISLASWYERVSFISQRAQVIDGTLRDNILFGLRKDAQAYWNDARLWEVVRQFRVDFGARLTHGLDTKVGRHGVQLSGGEAQRLLILSAAVKEPQFMIIDEATSSLDAESQRDVQLAIDALLMRTGASALIIAHRLSTIRACTKFIVLCPSSDAGGSEIEATASNLDELAAMSPTFRNLLALEHGTTLLNNDRIEE